MAIDRDLSSTGAQIKVIGIGGGGTNAINSMIRAQVEGVEFVAANTDMQSLKASLAPKRIQIGRQLTKGLGAGADPDIGRDAALEDRHELHESLDGSDMVFITAGMGGGTGTGGASVIAQIAKDIGALTVGVVTKPFFFEGNKRKKHAQLGIEKLREYVDTLIVIPNQQLLQIATPDLSMMDAFKLADTVLVNAVKGISDIINVPGTVNVDFADVKTIMSSTGRALMGIGSGYGEKRAAEAATKAISSPLLEDVDIEGATGILINITAGSNVSLLEINEACSIIQEAAHEDANIIFGAVIDDSLGDELRVTVIATGFPAEQKAEKIAQAQSSLGKRFGAETYSSFGKTKPSSYGSSQNSYAKEWAASLTDKPKPQTKPIEAVVQETPTHITAPLPQISQRTETEELAQLTLNIQTEVKSFEIKEEFTLDLDQLEAFQAQKTPQAQGASIHQDIPIHQEALPQKIAEKIEKKMDDGLNFERESRLDIPAFLRKGQPSIFPS